MLVPDAPAVPLVPAAIAANPHTMGDLRLAFERLLHSSGRVEKSSDGLRVRP